MSSALENLLQENRSFPPDPEFVKSANAQPGIHARAEENWKQYWLDQATSRLSWFKQPRQAVDESNAPFYKWFTDGEINLSYNCLDRHLAARWPITGSASPGMPALSPTRTSTARCVVLPTPYGRSD